MKIGSIGQYDIVYGVESNTGEFDQQAAVHVSLNNDLNVIQFDVDLDSLPGANSEGHEVVVNFKINNFTNN